MVNVTILYLMAVSRKAISIIAAIAIYNKYYLQELVFTMLLFNKTINPVFRHKVKRN